MPACDGTRLHLLSLTALASLHQQKGMIVSSGAGCLVDLQMYSDVPSAACLCPAMLTLNGSLLCVGLHMGGTAGLTPPGVAAAAPVAGLVVVPGQGGEHLPRPRSTLQTGQSHAMPCQTA